MRPSLSHFFSRVRVRLALWYLLILVGVLISFGGNLYASESRLAESAADAQMEETLYKDARTILSVYQPALLQGRTPTDEHLVLPEQEIALLFRPDGTLLDTRGPVTKPAIQTVQPFIERNQPIINTELVLASTDPHHQTTREYRIYVTPVFEKNTRIALLMVGLPRTSQTHTLLFWVLHAIGVLLVGTFGGYWLAGKALRPVQKITRMAREIHATDLRRRLNITRKDEFGELAATFDQMLVRLEAAFNRQTQFTADASHELRTPLTIIDLELNRALTQLHTPQEYRQVLESIRTENEQMSSIVTNLLLLARADTGQIVLCQEEVDLSDIALASVERLASLAQQSHITLSTGELPELIVKGDPQQLSRMVMNLIENAIKYTSAIGTRVYVDVTCKDQQWGIIRVKDDGPGIASEHLPYLFDRFYRVDKARSRRQRKQLATGIMSDEPGGTGLGLAIVQWIVQAHNGEVCVESTPGVGSLFEVRIPLFKPR